VPPFEVIPAIDVADGKLVRLSIGGPGVVGAFGGEPLAAAEAYVAAGARRLHVVDVDLAFTGRPGASEVVRRCAALGVRVQASGGIRDDGEADEMLAAGADRVVLGSAAFTDRDRLAATVARLGERAVVGVETDGDRVRPRGRDEAIELDLAETVGVLASVGARRCLHTSVRRVGELRGPDLDGLRFVLGAGVPVLVAGGIASIEDLAAVRGAGAEGAVVGRAALEGELDLATALGDDR